MRILLYIAIVGFCLSCQNNKIEKVYYENGQAKFEVEFSNGLMNGYHKEFHENGKLKTLTYYDSGNISDSIIGYFENGNIEFIQFRTNEIDSMYTFDKKDKFINSKSKVVNNQINGWRYYFNEKGEIISKIEFIDLLEDEPYINQGIYFDGNKIIDSLSAYYMVNLKDTLKVNKSYPIKFEYKPTISKDSEVYICYGSGINENYSNINNIKLDTLVLENLKLTTTIKLSKIGKHNLRGFFYEKHIEYLHSDKNDSLVNISTKSNKMYLNIEVFVKDEEIQRAINIQEQSFNGLYLKLIAFEIKFDEDSTIPIIKYVYDVTGVKLAKSVMNEGTISTLYAGGFVYNNAGGSQKLQFFSPAPEGSGAQHWEFGGLKINQFGIWDW